MKLVNGSASMICNQCELELPETNFPIHTGNKKLRKQCKKCYYGKIAKWEQRNPDRRLDYSKRFRSRHYELCLQRTREWRKNNLAYNVYRQSIYIARKQQQMPLWANKDKIKEIYLACPKEYHVNHIIPLKGKLVSGLHVENNLQYLLARDNIQKRNNYVV